jgi:hypothetical protein
MCLRGRAGWDYVVGVIQMMIEPDNSLLERTLAETRRSPAVVRAVVAVALTGALFLIQAAQFYTFYIAFYGAYKYAPPGVLVVGVALVWLGSRIYSQRVWAAKVAAGLTGVIALAMGIWYFARLGLGVNPLTALLPFASVTAAVFAARAIGPCQKTADARRRAAAAGLDLDLDR